jgi:Zn-dependent membrane protease YugP
MGYGYYGYYDMSYLIYMLPALIISLYAQARVSSAYKRYLSMPNKRGITGAQAAGIILASNGLGDIPVRLASGALSDHYNPKDKSLNLSSAVMGQASIASIAIAAHECGHAMQHHEKYMMLTVRNGIARFAAVSNYASWLLITLGMLFSYTGFLALGIALFSAVVLFQVVTMPVELDASRRALAALKDSGITTGDEELSGAKSMLSAAALTYIAAMLAGLLQLMRLISMFAGRKRR